MPAKGKGKRKVTTGPMDPRKTREPVTGHPDSDINAALDSVTLSPPHTDNGYDSDSSVVTTITTAPPPLTMVPASSFEKMCETYEAEMSKLRDWALTLITRQHALTVLLEQAIKHHQKPNRMLCGSPGSWQTHYT